MIHEPELAAEVTLQPVRLFGLDAAIIFSDIMAVPEAMGQPYQLVEGVGIRTEFSVCDAGRIAALSSNADSLRERLDYVARAMRLVRTELGGKTAFLGFAGAPWTLACYMTREGSEPDFSNALRLADCEPERFRSLMEKITDAVAAHLLLQIEAGADAVQIFDSCAAACPVERYAERSLQWTKRVISRLPKDVPVILFSRGKAAEADAMALLSRSGANVLSVDHGVDLRTVADSLPKGVAVQGNLPPELMETPPENVRVVARALLERMRGRDGFIVNLGHGIRPQARPESVAELVRTVREFC